MVGGIALTREPPLPSPGKTLLTHTCMKKLMLPIMAMLMLLLVACEEDALNQIDTPTIESEVFDINTFINSPEYEQLNPFLQQSLIEMSDPAYSAVPRNAPTGLEKSAAVPSNNAIRNLAEDQIECLDVAGRSSIVRKPSGVKISYHAKGLVPEQEYLIYVLALNPTESCGPDFSGGFLSFADAITLGRVKANYEGTLNLNTFQATGDNSNSWYGPLGHGVSDPMGSDIIIYTRIGGLFGGGTDLQNSRHLVCDFFNNSSCN